MTKIEINQKKYNDLAVKIRRDLHRIPEEGFKEYKTQKYIIAYLSGLGFKPEKICDTGAFVYIEGQESESDTIGFRADMDGLKIQENNTFDFVSEHEGKMHACGHDGHMTVLLLLATYLAEEKGPFRNNIILLFQPAEEGPGGASEVIKTNIFEKYGISKMFGLHVMPTLPEGKIGSCSGPLMAMTSEFEITVNGKSGHGAAPQEGIDAIVAASNLVISIQSIISRSINPIEPVVISVGQFNAGERVNIIPKQAILKGTMRSYNQKIHKKMQKRMAEITDGNSIMFNCENDIEFIDMYPPVINDIQMYEDLKSVVPEEDFVEVKPMMLAEDFSNYKEKVPILFFFLGIVPENGQAVELHSDKFNFNEKVLVTALEAYLNLLRMYSNK
jgi:amidohydrolase